MSTTTKKSAIDKNLDRFLTKKDDEEKLKMITLNITELQAKALIELLTLSAETFSHALRGQIAKPKAEQDGNILNNLSSAIAASDIFKEFVVANLKIGPIDNSTIN